ncbi:VIT1/CCC1 transporter family protein [Sutcliffiella horikoshii]|uniref:VIT1/CCC1 transporter family protein n=1 Tax=Sutcliffiella horikoshii TaxID=79883 RepID=UPI001CFCE5E5|nr:VIT1/CCC1 transporter family protein [Sutcliffiella horikoshii]
MNNNLNKPKGFGEILDQTFKISKYKFKDFFIILLLLVGPIYLLQAIIELATGKSFLRQEGGGGAWYEEMMRNMELTEDTSLSTNLAADIGTFFVSLLVLFTYPVAQAAILFGVNHIKHNREFTVSTVIKQAFGRFFPLIGSSLLYVIIAFSIIFGFILIGVLIPIMFFAIDVIAGVIVSIVLTVSLFLIGAFLLTRWSFFFGSVVLDKNSPGLTRSWRLSKGRTFKLIGLYIIFFLITTSIAVAIEMSVSAFLGNSVLLGLIVSFTTLFTTLIMAVGYAVMYLDLKVRHDADDLRDMIDEYHIS